MQKLAFNEATATDGGFHVKERLMRTLHITFLFTDPTRIRFFRAEPSPKGPQRLRGNPTAKIRAAKGTFFLRAGNSSTILSGAVP